jgi:hypothetical protein
MGVEPEKNKEPEHSSKGPETSSERLSTPCPLTVFSLDVLSTADQRRLLSHLKRINSAIETFGETISKTVIPSLTMAVQTPPSMAASTCDSISQAITNITSGVTGLYDTIDWFVRQGNEPLQEYRSLVQVGTQDAIRLLREANPTGDNENWRVKVHTATVLLQQAISDDCEVITPNLLLMIGELDHLLAKP